MTAIDNAYLLIQTDFANDLAAGKPILLDRPFIAKIEAIFDSFRQDYLTGWHQISLKLDHAYGYHKFIWSHGENGYLVTEMIFCRNDLDPWGHI